MMIKTPKKSRITLEQFLPFASTFRNRVEVCISNRGIYISCPFEDTIVLEPFLNWIVTDIGNIDTDAIRVYIVDPNPKGDNNA